MRDQYLARYAEPEAALADLVQGEWEHLVVVPVCAESVDALDGLAPAAIGRRVLAVVVVNGRVDHEPAIHAANEAFVRARFGDAESLAPGLWLRRGEPDLLLVDRSGPGRRFGSREGVGLARKIGSDVGLAMAPRVRSRWIHFTDADATLPASYFDAEQSAPSPARALVRPFTHVAGADTAVDEAHRRYELSLRYYVLGLRWAGSPYAFHTIGSVLGVDRDAYAGVRGVPRRQAGEDFYLLNKVAKLGPVHRVHGEPVQIMSRRSARVPFGTGPAVQRLLGDPQGPAVYAPESFVALRAWLAVLERSAAGDWDERDLDELAPRTRESLERALEQLAARPAVRELHRRHRGAARARQLHVWFDGFRTLKLVHALRDAGLGDRPWREACGQAPFLDGLRPEREVEHVLMELESRDLAP